MRTVADLKTSINEAFSMLSENTLGHIARVIQANEICDVTFNLSSYETHNKNGVSITPMSIKTVLKK